MTRMLLLTVHAEIATGEADYNSKLRQISLTEKKFNERKDNNYLVNNPMLSIY